MTVFLYFADTALTIYLNLILEMSSNNFADMQIPDEHSLIDIFVERPLFKTTEWAFVFIVAPSGFKRYSQKIIALAHPFFRDS